MFSGNGHMKETHFEQHSLRETNFPLEIPLACCKGPIQSPRQAKKAPKGEHKRVVLLVAQKYRNVVGDHKRRYRFERGQFRSTKLTQSEAVLLSLLSLTVSAPRWIRIFVKLMAANLPTSDARLNTDEWRRCPAVLQPGPCSGGYPSCHSDMLHPDW